MKKTTLLYVVFLCLMITQGFSQTFTEVENNNSVGNALASSQNRIYSSANYKGTVTSSDSDFWIISRKADQSSDLDIYFDKIYVDSNPNFNFRVWEYQGGNWGATPVNIGTLRTLKQASGIYNYSLRLPYSSNVSGGVSNNYYAIEVFTSASSFNYDFKIGASTINSFYYCYEYNIPTLTTTQVNDSDVSLNDIGVNFADDVYYIVKFSKTNSFTDFTDNYIQNQSLPTVAASNTYSGSGEHIAYVGTDDGAVMSAMTMTGLQRNTTYYYKVYSYSNCNGYINYNNTVTPVAITTCPGTPPGAGSVNTVTATSPTTATINTLGRPAAADTSIGYLVKFSDTNSFTAPVSGTTIAAASTDYSGKTGEQVVYTGAVGSEAGTTDDINQVISGLQVNKEYYVKVYTYQLCGGKYNFETTGSSVVTTNYVCAAPTAVTNVTAAATGTNTMSIVSYSASSVTNGSLGYVVKVNDVNLFTAPNAIPASASTVYNTATGGEQVMYVGNSVTPNLNITGLVANGTYFVKVYAYNTCGGTNYFDVTGSTVVSATTCGTPSGNSELLSFREDLTWENRLSPVISNVPAGVEGQIVKMNIENSFTDITGVQNTLPTANTSYAGSGEQVILAGAFSNGHAFTGHNLLSNTEYFFKIYSYKECNGKYYFSNTNHTTSKFTAGVTDKLVTNPVINNFKSSAFTLASFTGAPVADNGNGLPTGYVVKMNIVDSFTPYSFNNGLPTASASYSGGEQVVYVGASTTPNIEITGLIANATYYFSIYAYKEHAAPYYFKAYQQTGHEFSVVNNAALVDPTITFNNLTAQVGDANFNLNATSTSTGAINYEIINDGGTGTTLSGTNNKTVTVGSKSGIVLIKASQEATATHQSANKTITLTISNQSAAISGFIGYEVNSGITTLDMTTSLNTLSTGAFTFEIIGEDLGYSVNGNLLNVNNVAGSVIIKVTQAADANYGEGIAYISTIFYNAALNPKVSLAHNLFDFSLDVGETKTIEEAINVLATPVTYSIVDDGGTGSTISGNVFTAGNLPGTVTLRSSSIEDSIYLATSKEVTVTVTGTLPQDITFTALAPKTYGDATFDLTATASSNLPITYVSSDTSVATISGNTVTIVGAGSTTITASQAGNSIYNPAIDIQQNLVINKKELTIAPQDATITYGVLDLPADGSTENYPYSVVGLVNGDVAEDVIKLSTIIADISDLEIVNAANAGQPLDVGTHNGVMTWKSPPVLELLSANYEYNALGTGNLTVNAAPVTVTAEAKSKTYDNDSATDPVLTYTVDLSGLPTGTDVITYPSPLSFTGSLSKGTNQNAGVYEIQLGTLTLGNNYAITYNSANFTINKATLLATSNSSKIYGDALATIPVQYVGFVGSDNASLVDTPPTVIPTVTVDETTNAGEYEVNVTGGLDNNYTINTTNGTLTVTKRTLQGAVDNATKMYGDANPTYTVQYTGFVNGDTAADIAQPLTFGAYESDGTTYVSETTGVGEYFITNLPGQFLADNYFIQITNLGVAKLSVTKRAITATADAATKIYGDTDPALTYQITSGSLVNGDVFSGSLTREIGETVYKGSSNDVYYKINQGSLALNSNYDLNFVTANFRVFTKNVNFSIENQTKVYGTADPVPTATIVDGTAMAYDDTFVLTNALRSAGENVGDYDYGFIGTGNFEYDITSSHSTDVRNYQFNFRRYGYPKLTITKAPQDITFNALADKTYGDTTFDLTATASSGLDVTYVSSNTSVATISGNKVTIVGAGSTTITASQSGNGNYDAATDVPQTLTVSKKDLAITPVVVGAIEYGLLHDLSGNVPLNVTGFVNGDDVSILTVTPSAKARIDYSVLVVAKNLPYDVGSYPEGARVNGANAIPYERHPNYNFTFPGVPLTVVKRNVTITADAITKVYGEVDPTLTYQNNLPEIVVDNKVYDTSTFAVTGSLTREVGEDVGTYAINQGDLAVTTTNYNITYAAANLEITKKAIEVTADAKTKTYGDADPVLTYQITSGSLINTDAFTGSLSRAAGQAKGTYAINQGTLALGANYDLSFVSNDLQIGARFIKVMQATPLQKVYGDSDPALTWVHTITEGSLAYDDTLETYGTFRDNGENVGSYQIRGLSSRFTSNNGGASSYAVTYMNSGSVQLNITARALEVTADAKSKVYGDNDPVLTYKVTNGTLQFSDAFTGSLERVVGESVGNYAINQGSLVLNNNYNITFVNGDLNITKRNLTVTADSFIKVAGESDPGFTYQITTGSLATSDVFTGSLERVSGETIGNYAINQGTLALNSNYNLTYIAGNLEVIESKNATALNFEGLTNNTYDYIEIADNPSLDFTNEFSFETKVNFDEITRYTNGWDWQCLFAKSRYNESYGLMLLTEATKTLRFYHAGFGTGFTDYNWTPTLVAKKWYHVAVTFNGTKAAIYIDGVEVASQTASAGSVVPNNLPLMIGAGRTNGGDPYPLQGTLDEVRLWNVARTATQINDYKSYELEGNENGLVLNYDMNQGIGSANNTAITNVTDKSSNANHGVLKQFALTGTVSNFVNDVTSGVTPKQEQVITFNALSNKTYGAADFNLSASSDSGLPITFTSSDNSIATISGNTVSIIGVGTTTITASQEGTAVYKSAVVNQNLTIVAGANQAVWSGATNSSWTTASNWSNNTTPSATNNAVIPNVATTPEITSNVQVNDLEIESLSSFDISADGSVTVDGDFTNNGSFTITSNSSNSGTLVTNGSVTGNVTYERGGLKANVWSIVSAPVSGQSIKDFVENASNEIRKNTSVTPNRYAVGYYDDSKPAGSKWIYYTTDDLAANTLTFEAGKSYAISRATDGSVTFTGTVATADVPKAVTASEWNAVGNPYTAFMPINENSGTNFINENLAKFDPVNVGVYVWDNSQSKYVGKSLVTDEASLAPGQGFFVKTTTGVNNIMFNQAQRMTQPLTGGTFSRGSKESSSIQLQATLGKVTVDTNIKYFENATLGLDPGYDLGNYARSSFDVYTRLVGSPEAGDFTIQSLPLQDIAKTIIPIGVKAASGSSITFNVKHQNLPEGLTVFIEDKKLNTFTELNADEVYTVEIDEKVNGVGRFYLHTKSSELPQDVLSINEVKIYNVDNTTLIIEGIATGDFDVQLYNTVATKVMEQTIQGQGKNIITLPALQSGVYIVRISTALGVKSKKIIIK